MPAGELRDRVTDWWGDHLGCGADVLRSAQTCVVAHQDALRDYAGVFLARIGTALVVSAPEPLLESLRRALEGRTPDEAFDADCVAGWLGPAAEAVSGPSWLGYADRASFRPADPRGTRRLDQRDVGSLWELSDACDATDWENSGISFAGTAGFGCFLEDRLVAASMLEQRRAGMLDVGAITHPDHRGQGYGRAVMSAAASHGLDRDGALLQYRTLEGNASSVGLARSLGFALLARTIAIRLGDART